MTRSEGPRRRDGSGLHGRRAALYIAALGLAGCGVGTLVVAASAQETAPTPTAAAHGTLAFHPTTTVAASGAPTKAEDPAEASSKEGTPSVSPPVAPRPLNIRRSRPASISIPAIGVQSTVIALGKNADGSLAVPQPGPNLNKVAWYKGSSSPGQTGPAVIEGHVDSVYGPSVFFRLGAIRPGNTIVVTLKDGAKATFVVNAVRTYATHDDFPVGQIFGSDIAYPTLRLITCSNFDETIHHYLGNTVVYAHLTSVQR